MSEKNNLLELTVSDIPAVVELIELAMNSEEAKWAEQSICLHFELEKQGISDGRDYFVKRDAKKIIGVIGLHHYDWGPKENVWLSWFAVHPQMQKQGIGRAMFSKILQLAKQRNYQKLFVETYSGEMFERARKFYLSCGMKQCGQIKDYLPNHTDMIIFKKELN